MQWYCFKANYYKMLQKYIDVFKFFVHVYLFYELRFVFRWRKSFCCKPNKYRV